MPRFTEPPQPKNKIFGSIPKFMRSWYKPAMPAFDLEYILELIKWAEKEFADTRAWLILNHNERGIKLFRKATCLNLLAYTKEFDELVKNMNSEIWNSIPSSVQDTLIKTKAIYDAKSI